MVNLRTKLLIPVLLTALLAVAGIVYISILQYQLFRHQTEHRMMGHKQHLHLLIGNLQKKSHELIELLSNKWRFLDSISAGNMDILLNEITPFHKNRQYDFIAVYNMEGITIARGDSPDHFGMLDDLYEHIMKAKKGETRKSFVTLYDNKLLLLELKRLETSYRPIGFLAVGQYLDEKTVNIFVQVHQLYLGFQYKDAEVCFNNSILPANIDKNRFQVEFTDELGQDSPLSAILWEDTSKLRSKFRHNFFIVMIVLVLASYVVIYFSRRIFVNTVNTLDKARTSAERALFERKQAEEALKQLNEALEERVQERTQDLKAEIFEHKQAEGELKKYQDHLEELVEDRTNELKKKTDKIEESRKALTYLVEDVNEAGEELRKVNMEYSAANKELKEFAYIVSHDLKAPLRAISQLTQWISEDYSEAFDDDGKMQMDLILKRVKRMNSLIDGILRYSRVGQIRKKEERLDLNLLVNEVIDNIAPPDNIQIIFENKLPVIFRDSIRMEQVFQNLIGNAIKFMDKGEGIIKVGCVDDGAYWNFSVSDNGPGIDKRYHDKIFRIFQTLVPRDEHESTGIGLALVKKIIGQYGGSVSVESEAGHGATFFFTLPKKGEKI